jgi:hypothetical protein
MVQGFGDDSRDNNLPEVETSERFSFEENGVSSIS